MLYAPVYPSTLVYSSIPQLMLVFSSILQCTSPYSFAEQVLELVDSFPNWMGDALKDLPKVLKQTKMKGGSSRSVLIEGGLLSRECRRQYLYRYQGVWLLTLLRAEEDVRGKFLGKNLGRPLLIWRKVAHSNSPLIISSSISVLRYNALHKMFPRENSHLYVHP